MISRAEFAVVMLDFLLIAMTGGWILAAIYRGISNLELWYSFIYVSLNMATLILNLIIIKAKKQQ